MENRLKILGTLTGPKYEIAERFIDSFRDTYPSVDGEMYLGYPIYHDEVSGRKVCVDIALISKIGVFIINILTIIWKLISHYINNFIYQFITLIII